MTSDQSTSLARNGKLVSIALSAIAISSVIYLEFARPSFSAVAVSLGESVTIADGGDVPVRITLSKVFKLEHDPVSANRVFDIDRLADELLTKVFEETNLRNHRKMTDDSEGTRPRDDIEKSDTKKYDDFEREKDLFVTAIKKQDPKLWEEFLENMNHDADEIIFETEIADIEIADAIARVGRKTTVIETSPLNFSRGLGDDFEMIVGQVRENSRTVSARILLEDKGSRNTPSDILAKIVTYVVEIVL